MASLHAALQVLGPAPFSSVPTEEPQASEYLQDILTQCQLIVDSIPLPPAEELIPGTRSRANTGSEASSVLDISASPARSEPLDSSSISLQKEWGKPIKLAAKDNPLGIAVYKLSGKDGRGAWFARRSVHEGLGFQKWKLGFEREFPESLAVQGGPGEGNVRGIGGERRVEQMEISGIGKVEVYHLSAQFPGPTTPRDFVTLLITSDSEPDHPEKRKLSHLDDKPRNFMVVSKPCLHPECPPRDGFIRGQYESVEFIREIPRKPKRSASNLEMTKARSEEQALLDEHQSASSSEQPARTRQRGKTVSFLETEASQAKRVSSGTANVGNEDGAEIQAVEWIMVTRSDPGGAVPRFMVERGTPGGIVSDASKFLDWACKKDHDIPHGVSEAVRASDPDRATSNDLEAKQANGHLASLKGLPAINQSSEDVAATPPGLLANLVNMAKEGVETYAPQVIIDQLNGDPQQGLGEMKTSVPNEAKDTDDDSSISGASFASAAEGYDDDTSAKSTSSHSTKHTTSVDQSAHDKELAKLQDRKRALDEKFAKSREKELKDKEELTSKEQDRLRKAEEKHRREVDKQEAKYRREVAKLEAKRTKETVKEEERKKKELDKDEKARLTREKEELRQELEVVRMERDVFRDQVGALQHENTSLVARLGKSSDGRSVLKEVQAEIASRSRSSSIRRGEETGSGVEVRIVAGEMDRSSS